MICKTIDTQKRYYPIPISFLVKTANAFICDIFIQFGNYRVDVKNYDDLHDHLRGNNCTMLFYFNGMDELAAQKKMETIFSR
ncbi:MAG: HPr family phosphocarrier protein [Lachnospiraceae bacterium]